MANHLPRGVDVQGIRSPDDRPRENSIPAGRRRSLMPFDYAFVQSSWVGRASLRGWGSVMQRWASLDPRLVLPRSPCKCTGGEPRAFAVYPTCMSWTAKGTDGAAQRTLSSRTPVHQHPRAQWTPRSWKPKGSPPNRSAESWSEPHEPMTLAKSLPRRWARYSQEQWGLESSLLDLPS